MSTKAKVIRTLKIPDSPCLGEVVTLAEARVLSGMSRTALFNAIDVKRLKARRSITGGEWLIDLRSLIAEYPSTELNLWQIK